MTYYNIQLEALVFFCRPSARRLIVEIQEKVFSLKIISKKKTYIPKTIAALITITLN